MNKYEERGLIIIGRKSYEFSLNPTKNIFEEYGKFDKKIFYREITNYNVIRILMKKIEIKDYFELFNRCVKYPYDPNYTDTDKRDEYGDLYYNAGKKVFVFTSQGEFTLFTEGYILDFIENDKL